MAAIYMRCVARNCQYLNVVCNHQSQEMQIVYVRLMCIIQQKTFFLEPTSNLQAIDPFDTVAKKISLLIYPSGFAQTMMSQGAPYFHMSDTFPRYVSQQGECYTNSIDECENHTRVSLLFASNVICPLPNDVQDFHFLRNILDATFITIPHVHRLLDFQFF